MESMKKAFTLIELLVVIAIIAILAAMLMPALAKARLEARKAACAGNLHNFGLQYAMYTSDWNGHWPGALEGQGSVPEALGALYPMHSDNLLQFSCPGYPTEPFVGSIQGSGYSVDLFIPTTADPARAVMADRNILNHGGGGSEILFTDSHVQWARKWTNNLGESRVPNPQLTAGAYDRIDTDIYMLQHTLRDPSVDATQYDYDAEIREGLVLNAPVAVDDFYGPVETILNVSAPGVLGNDLDANGDTLTAVLVSVPPNGTLTFNPDGSFEYIPDDGFVGEDSFTYKAYDGIADSNLGTVRIGVPPSL